jgi:hypothetical protein
MRTREARQRTYRWPITNHFLFSKETIMPLILWLLGVPLSVVLLLMLFGVF